MKPVANDKNERWINVYDDGDWHVFTSEVDAVDFAYDCNREVILRLKAIGEIELSEGELWTKLN